MRSAPTAPDRGRRPGSGPSARVGGTDAVRAGAVVLADPLGCGPATFGREARHPLAGGRRVADLVTTIALLVVLAAESVAAGAGIVFLSLAFGSCAAPGNTCDEAFGGAVVSVGPMIVAVVLVATLAACVLRLVHRRLSWPVVLVGMAGVVAVFSAAVLLVDSAISHGI